MWNIKFDEALEKQIKKIDLTNRKRIFDFLRNRVALLDNPRTISEPMKGNQFSGLCRYRVGDYRIICRIEDETVTILVVRIGHRKEIYN
jgi:mRNA interferase RelE/StbE